MSGTDLPVDVCFGRFSETSMTPEFMLTCNVTTMSASRSNRLRNVFDWSYTNLTFRGNVLKDSPWSITYKCDLGFIINIDRRRVGLWNLYDMDSPSANVSGVVLDALTRIEDGSFVRPKRLYRFLFINVKTPWVGSLPQEAKLYILKYLDSLSSCPHDRKFVCYIHSPFPLPQAHISGLHSLHSSSSPSDSFQVFCDGLTPGMKTLRLNSYLPANGACVLSLLEPESYVWDETFRDVSLHMIPSTGAESPKEVAKIPPFLEKPPQPPPPPPPLPSSGSESSDESTGLDKQFCLPDDHSCHEESKTTHWGDFKDGDEIKLRDPRLTTLFWNMFISNAEPDKQYPVVLRFSHNDKSGPLLTIEYKYFRMIINGLPRYGIGKFGPMFLRRSGSTDPMGNPFSPISAPSKRGIRSTLKSLVEATS